MRHVSALSIVFVSALLVSSVPAKSKASIELAEELDFFVFQQNVDQFLQDLERETSLRFNVSPAVQGQIKNMRLKGEVAPVMEEITRQLGLDWYAFNGLIYVSSKNEAITRVVRLGDLQPDDVLNALNESGVPVIDFPAQITADGSALAFSGPPTLLALIEAIIDTIPQAHQIAASTRSIVVRRGVEVQLVPVR